jgi:hypothetical protein
MQDFRDLSGSQSVARDQRGSARPPTFSIAFARSRAPDHDRDGLTTSTDPDHAPYSRSSLTFARSKTLVIVLPINAIRGLKLHPQPPRPVRDPQIPIASPSYPSPHPSRGFLLARLSNAGPQRLAQPS